MWPTLAGFNWFNTHVTYFSWFQLVPHLCDQIWLVISYRLVKAEIFLANRQRINCCIKLPQKLFLRSVCGVTHAKDTVRYNQTYCKGYSLVHVQCLPEENIPAVKTSRSLFLLIVSICLTGSRTTFVVDIFRLEFLTVKESLISRLCVLCWWNVFWINRAPRWNSAELQWKVTGPVFTVQTLPLQELLFPTVYSLLWEAMYAGWEMLPCWRSKSCSALMLPCAMRRWEIHSRTSLVSVYSPLVPFCCTSGPNVHLFSQMYINIKENHFAGFCRGPANFGVQSLKGFTKCQKMPWKNHTGSSGSHRVVTYRLHHSQQQIYLLSFKCPRKTPLELFS